MVKKLNYASALLCMIIAGLLCHRMGLRAGLPWAGVAVCAGVLHMILPAPERKRESAKPFIPPETPTELTLLNEEGSALASWDLYGKNGIVIGRDVGENQVTVNLDHTDYAAMVDVEHAVLNYTGDTWYVEDISSKNGVSVQKSDGRKYRLSYGKPCKLEQGDIIFIGPVRLQLR
ncbi:MAG: FHA domain-containing protein [Roseburia sp.]|nr:FHA domain-containing protein [Roseburia sp.]